MNSLRAAVVGYGSSGRLIHSPLIRATDGIEVAAVVARSPDVRRLASTENPGAHVLHSFEELLEHAHHVDVVIVCTPDAAHFEIAKHALSAGLHVVVDKPLAQSSEQIAKLVELAEHRRLLLTAFQNMRWNGDFLTAKALISSGQIGRILRFESRIARWSPEVGDTWREQPRDTKPDGPLADLGSHAVDQAVALFGSVASVYAELDRHRPGSRVDDDVFLALTHASGVRTHLHVGYQTSSELPRFVMQGSEGSYLKHGTDPQFAALMRQDDPLSRSWGKEPESQWGTLTSSDQVRKLATVNGDWRAFYRSLIASLREGAAPPIDRRESLHVLRVLEAASASQASQTLVHLDVREPSSPF